MTTYKRLLALVVIILSMTGATYADRYVTNGNYVYEIVKYYDHDEEEAIIVARAPGFNPSGEIVIPGTVTIDGKTYQVTHLGDYFNYYNTLPDFPPVFSDLPGLTSVIFPKEMTRYSPNEFENCPALGSFRVDKRNPAYFSRDGILYGRDNTQLYLVRIPPAMKLTSFALPSDIRGVQEYAFAGNTTLKTVILEGEQGLGACWQLGNKSITDIDVSKSTRYDTKRSKNGFLFHNGSSIQALMSVAPGVAMESYTMPTDINSIVDGAFANSSIRHVILGDNLNSGIPAALFQGADIEAITIPATMSYDIGFGAFRGCKNLTSVTLKAHTADATEISPYAFSKCDRLSKVTIESKNPLTISRYAFTDCPALSEVSIPDGTKIPEIGKYAFAGCKALSKFSLLNVKEMSREGYQFAGTGLTKVNWPSSLIDIPEGCFKDCTSLKEVNLKETTDVIGLYAFHNTAIETLNLAGTRLACDSSFTDCLQLRKIVIPANPELVSIAGAFSCDVAGTQLIINTPLSHAAQSGDPMKFGNVDAYTSVNDEYEAFLPYVFDATVSNDERRRSNWRSVNVPAHASAYYEKYSVKPVAEMFSYYNDPAKKTATVISLNSLVSIKGVTIEGVAATQNGNVWSAPKAVISGKDKMNVTIDYTVNGAKMQTTYTEVYSAASTDDMTMPDDSTVSITLNGRTADFGTDTAWTVYTLQGGSVASGSGRLADLGNLPAGMYVIRAGGSALKTILK